MNRKISCTLIHLVLLMSRYVEVFGQVNPIVNSEGDELYVIDTNEEDIDDEFSEENIKTSVFQNKNDETKKEKILNTSSPTSILTELISSSTTESLSVRTKSAPTMQPTMRKTSSPTMKPIAITMSPTFTPTKHPMRDSETAANVPNSEEHDDYYDDHQDQIQEGEYETMMDEIKAKLTPDEVYYLSKYEFKEEEEEAAKISIVYFVVTLTLMIFTAHQLSEHPDGVYANLCRLSITLMGVFFKVLLFPFRRFCGLGTRKGYAHHLVTNQNDFRDPYASTSPNNRMEIL